MGSVAMTLLLGMATGQALASDPEAPSGGAPAKRGFIEKSLLLAPETVGKFCLYSANDYPGDPGSGVGFRYQHADFPEVRIDLFVYPIGRVDRDTAVVQGIAEVRASVQNAADQGGYADLVFGDETEFDLRRVDASGDLMPAGEVPGHADDDEIESQVLRAMAGADAALEPAIGRRLDMQLSIGGAHQNSRGYQFYRGLYLYKGRISAPPTLLPGEAFDRFTNHAMASLIPAIQVRSTGACHESSIYIDPDKEDTADFAGQVRRAMLRSELEQCEETLDESIPDGFRALTLEFDPAAWREGR
jgi:hypothetical protein